MCVPLVCGGLATGDLIFFSARHRPFSGSTGSLQRARATALTLVLLCCCRTTMLEVVEDITQRVCGAQD